MSAPNTPTSTRCPGPPKGAGIGGALGGGAGLLAGLGLLAIPGLGPVVAAGWLAATAVGAAAGAATGGIVGALVDAGVDREHADVYSEIDPPRRHAGDGACARRGRPRVEAILAPTSRSIRSPAARSIARPAGQTFDPKAPPYRPNQAEIDRMRANWPG